MLVLTVGCAMPNGSTPLVRLGPTRFGPATARANAPLMMADASTIAAMMTMTTPEA
jgi:hypothetical protein